MAYAALRGREGLGMKQFPLSIVSVGRDWELLQQRERAIGSRSDLQIRSLTPEEAEGPARSGEAHLWIFCNTVELPKLAYLASSVRRYSPASRLLLLKSGRKHGFEDSLFHGIFRVDDDPEDFLRTVSRLAVAA